MLPQMKLRSLWPVAVAIVAGFALLPPVHQEYRAWAVQRAILAELAQPVVKLTGRLVQRDDTQVLMRITGEKLRSCRYAGITAFAINASGVRRGANIELVGAVPQRGVTVPVGAYDFGLWRVWPVDADAAVIMVFVEHVCGSVIVQTMAAEVRL